MGRIGFRYRPFAQADLAAHAARLAMLCDDLADVPPDLLERAATRHAQNSKHMPTAAELIALARETIDGERQRNASAGGMTDLEYRHQIAARYNADMPPHLAGWKEWHVTDAGELKLRLKDAA